MSKHTPGPWIALNTHDIFTALGAKNAEGTECFADDGWHIADVDQGDLNLDEMRANARLIAAAPELLEALVNLLKVHEGEGGTKYHAGDIARAAIAKATGEQQ